MTQEKTQLKINCCECNKEILRRVDTDTAIQTAIKLNCAEGYINYLKSRKQKGLIGFVKNPDYDLSYNKHYCLDCARKEDIKTEQDGYIISIGSCI